MLHRAVESDAREIADKELPERAARLRRDEPREGQRHDAIARRESAAVVDGHAIARNGEAAEHALFERDPRGVGARVSRRFAEVAQ